MYSDYIVLRVQVQGQMFWVIVGRTSLAKAKKKMQSSS